MDQIKLTGAVDLLGRLLLAALFLIDGWIAVNNYGATAEYLAQFGVPVPVAGSGPDTPGGRRPARCSRMEYPAGGPCAVSLLYFNRAHFPQPVRRLK